jgi:hypothetical protein
MREMSDFTTILNQVLTLTEQTTNEASLTQPGTAEWHRSLGRLDALHQVISFFLEIDSRKCGPVTPDKP